LKIAFIIGEIHPNAGQTYDISEIIKFLLPRHSDWEFFVLTPKIHYPIVEGMKNRRVRIVQLHQYYVALLFRKRLSKMLKAYDILYIKGNFPYVFPAVKSGKPTILVVHQMDSPKLFHGMGQKLKIIGANLLTAYVIKKPDAVVTITDELATSYKNRYGITVHVIEDQISDLYFSAPARVEPGKSQVFKLLTAGNWDGPHGRKRHDFLLHCFADAVKIMPNLRISMVGLSERNLIDLGLLSEGLKVKEYVTLKGYLNEKALLEEFVASHTYVTATTYEGFYRQIVEGFATGMPAVVYDAYAITRNLSSSASANHVLKSGAGLLYLDSKSFVESLKNVVENYSLFSSKARSYAIIFSGKLTGLKTENLLERMANEKRKSK
jgi:glycosyltransferase involved in cell wall biosynthesis